VTAGSVRELQFDSMKLVSGSRDCTIRVFDLTRLEEFADEGKFTRSGVAPQGRV
jgi:hypothetical protein